MVESQASKARRISLRGIFSLVAIASLGAGPDAPSTRFPKGLSHAEYGPTNHHDGPSTSSTCAECHAEVSEAWALSGHANAASHFVFRVSVDKEKHAETCVRCHAPSRDEPAGVGCAACHVVDGRVVSKRALAGPYPVAEDPAFRDGRLCAGCHQFGFAIRRGGNLVGLTTDHQQQDTFSEHAAWAAQTRVGTGCVRCHFDGHTFGGKRRYRRLAGALRVTYDADKRALMFRLTGVGHGLPTGDVMRWISVEVAQTPTFDRPRRRIAAFRRRIEHRDWGDGQPPHPGIAEDHRLWPGRTTPVPIPDGPWKYWRVVYHLLPETYEMQGALPIGLSARTILEGTIP